MEIGLILVAICLMVWDTYTAWRTKDILAESIRLSLAVQKSLDRLSVLVENLSEVEDRLARKQQARDHVAMLKEAKEGGWKGV